MEGVNRWSMDYDNHENAHRRNAKSMIFKHFDLEQKIAQKQVMQMDSFLRNTFLSLLLIPYDWWEARKEIGLLECF